MSARTGLSLFGVQKIEKDLDVHKPPARMTLGESVSSEFGLSAMDKMSIKTHFSKIDISETHMHMHTEMQRNTHVHTNTHTQRNTEMHTNIYRNTHAHKRAHMQAHKNGETQKHTYIHRNMHTHPRKHTHNDINTPTQVYTQASTQTYMNTISIHKHMHTQKHLLKCTHIQTQYPCSLTTHTY